MSRPTPRYPQLGYHIIFNFRQGRFYNRPNARFLAGFLTILARALEDFGIGVAAWSLMGSHIHLLVYDLDPNRSVSNIDPFVKFLGGAYGQWLNHQWDRKGKVVSRNCRTRVIAITDIESEIRTAVYIGLNPVAAGIVEDVAKLVGTTSLPEFILSPISAERPDDWFDKKKWPENPSVTLGVPPLAWRKGYDRRAWYIKLKEQQTRSHVTILALRQMNGLPTENLEWALRQSPDEPRHDRVSHSETLFTGTDKALLARFFRLVRRFRRAYDRCLTNFREALEPVVFPTGTSKMATAYGVEVGPAGFG